MATVAFLNSPKVPVAAEPTDKVVSRMRLRTHAPANKSGSDAELIIHSHWRKDLMPGDVIELSKYPENENDGYGNIMLTVQEESFNDGVPGGKDCVSVLDTIINNKNFSLAAYNNVVVTKVLPTPMDLLVVTCRDTYLSRNDMWKLKKVLEGGCAYLDKRLSLPIPGTTMQISVSEIWTNGQRVSCGHIDQATRLCCRSSTSALHLFIQMSAEMWQYDSYGDLYFEKAVGGFLTELFNKWKEEDCCHDVTIVMFSRTYYKASSKDDFPEHMRDSILEDHNGKFYEDYYKVVIQNERYEDWSEPLTKLKTNFINYESAVLRVDERESAAQAEKHPIPEGRNSSAAEGNFLEVLNMSLNVYEKYYIDRNFDRLGKTAVVITPGPGVFEVDRELMKITKHRTIESGCAADLICMGEQPLHQVPLLRYKLPACPGCESSFSKISPRNWINHSFYTSQSQLRFTTSSRFVSRIKVATRKSDSEIDGLDSEAPSADGFLACKHSFSSFDDDSFYDKHDADVFKMTPTAPKHIRMRSATALDRRFLSSPRLAEVGENSDTNAGPNGLLHLDYVPIEPLPASLAERETDSDASNNDEPDLASSVDKPEFGSLLGNIKRMRQTSLDGYTGQQNIANLRKMTPNHRRWAHALPHDRHGNVIQPHHILSQEVTPNPYINSQRLITAPATKLQRVNSQDSRLSLRLFHYPGEVLSGVSVMGRHDGGSSDSLEPNDLISPVQSHLYGSPVDLNLLPGKSYVGSLETGTEIYRRSTSEARSLAGDMHLFELEIENLDLNTTITTGVDWRSLTTPAILPITTDYFPDETVLMDYTDNIYQLDPLDNDMDSKKFFEELISTRVALGLQLIRPAEKTRLEKAESKLSPIDSSSKRTDTPKRNRATPIKTDKNVYHLSIGKIFHELRILDGIITVKVQKEKNLPQPRFYDYKYRFLCPDSEHFALSKTKFQNEQLEKYEWNYLDNYVLSRGMPGDADDSEYNKTNFDNWKYWRSRYYLLPNLSQPLRTIKDAVSNQGLKADIRCDIFSQAIQGMDLMKNMEACQRFLEVVNQFRPIRQRSGNGAQPIKIETNTSDSSPTELLGMSEIRKLYETFTEPGKGLAFMEKSTLPKCSFTTYEACHWIVRTCPQVPTLSDALRIIKVMYDQKWIDHISRSSSHKGPIFGFHIYFIVEANDRRQVLPKHVPGEWVEVQFDIPQDEVWEVDEEYFTSIEESIFMDEVRQYPVLYDTGKKKYKNSRTCKQNAWRAVAKPLKGTIQLCETRYKTIRTRVGRYLKSCRPSGSGTADFQVHPEYEKLQWMFKFITTRSTISSLSTPADESNNEAVGADASGAASLEADVAPVLTQASPADQDPTIHTGAILSTSNPNKAPALTNNSFPVPKLSRIDVRVTPQPDMQSFLSSSHNSSIASNLSNALANGEDSKLQQPEWCSILYPPAYDPTCAYSIELNWILATGVLLFEMINQWSRKVNLHGVHIVPIPCDPFAIQTPTNTDPDPLRGPICVPLPEELHSKLKKCKDGYRFLLHILHQFGCLPASYSMRRYADVNKTRFVHCTGAFFVMPQISQDRVGFNWAWNFMLTKRWWNSSGSDEAFQDTILRDFRSFCKDSEGRLTQAFSAWFEAEIPKSDS